MNGSTNILLEINYPLKLSISKYISERVSWWSDLDWVWEQAWMKLWENYSAPGRESLTVGFENPLLGLSKCSFKESFFGDWLIWFWLCWVFGAVWAPLQLRWLLVLWSVGSRARRLQEQCCLGLVAPHHVESSRTRDQTRVSCIGRQILNHWNAWEAQSVVLYQQV